MEPVHNAGIASVALSVNFQLEEDDRLRMKATGKRKLAMLRIAAIATLMSHSCFQPFKVNRSAFSLTEILVALAIMAILTALSVPILSDVMVRQKIAESSSNMRQLTTAAILYANDNQGVFPQFNSKNGQGWTNALWPYLYKDIPFPGYGHNQEGTVFYSPLIESAPKARSYGINKTLEILQYGNRRYMLLPAPSKIALLMDTSTSSAADLNQINYRNAGKALVGYVDGHVQNIAPEDTPKKNGNIFWSGSYEFKQ